MSLRLVIVDDHAFVASGLALLLQETADIDVVATVSDARRAAEAVLTHRPDVVLADMSMPHLSGPELIGVLRQCRDAPPVVVLSALTDHAEIAAAFRAGAVNYVFKDEPLDTIAAAVIGAAEGQPKFSDAVAMALATHLTQPDPGVSAELSSREKEILTLVSLGMTNRQICRQLHLSEATVKTYLTRCYTKLGVTDRASAVRVAMEQGLLTE